VRVKEVERAEQLKVDAEQLKVDAEQKVDAAQLAVAGLEAELAAAAALHSSSVVNPLSKFGRGENLRNNAVI
jgi:hypothetical protein